MTFQAHFEPKRNKVLMRYECHSRTQNENQTCERFFRALQVFVKDCGYGNSY